MSGADSETFWLRCPGVAVFSFNESVGRACLIKACWRGLPHGGYLIFRHDFDRRDKIGGRSGVDESCLERRNRRFKDEREGAPPLGTFWYSSRRSVGISFNFDGLAK